MTTKTDLLPDVTRTDTEIVVVAGVTVERAEDQRRAADAVLDAWDLVMWPAGLLSHTVMLGTDGVSVRHYLQWASLEALEEFEANDAPQRTEYIAKLAPPLQRELPVQYTLYRHVDSNDSVAPGIIVLIDVEFDGPDHGRLRDWVDVVIAALEHDEGVNGLPVGGLGAYFHVSLDGTRVLNYAEWESEETHEAALQTGGGESIGDGDPWERVRNYPGLKRFGFKRFVPYRTRSAPEGSIGP